MGTRHLVRVVRGGRVCVSQYGQWDGYPSYTGAEIAKFLSDPESVERLRKAAPLLKFMTNEEIRAYNEKLINDADFKIESTLSRDTGWKILELIASSEDPASLLLVEAKREREDAWIEYVWTVDLDESVLREEVHGVAVPLDGISELQLEMEYFHPQEDEEPPAGAKAKPRWS